MADPDAPGAGLAPILRRLLAMERQIRDLASPSGTQKEMSVRRQPQLDVQVAQQEGFGLTGGFQTYATVTLSVPERCTKLQVLAVGSAAALDQTTGGATSSYARIQIDATASRSFPAAKDAGASKVNNVLVATWTSVLDVTGRSSVTVALQVQPLNAAAFPAHIQNFAQLTVIGSFTIA